MDKASCLWRWLFAAVQYAKNKNSDVISLVKSTFSGFSRAAVLLALPISTLPLVLHMTLTLESNRTPTQWQTANHDIMISMAFGKKQLHGEQTKLDRHIRGDVGSISTCAELHTRIASQSRRANTEWQTHSNLQAKYTLSFTLLAPDRKRKTRVFEENH